MGRNDSSHEPVMVGGGECIRETDAAIQVELKSDRKDTFGYNTDKTIWIPKSVLHADSEVYELHGIGTVIVKRWFAEREGLGGA